MSIQLTEITQRSIEDYKKTYLSYINVLEKKSGVSFSKDDEFIIYKMVQDATAALMNYIGMVSRETPEIKTVASAPPVQDSNTPEMITIKEASERTNVSYDFIRKMCINNQITHVRAGTKYLVNYGKLKEYLNSGGC